MKILIIEDEELAAGRMMQLLNELEPGCELSGPLDTVKAAIAHLEKTQDYDLMFLDIQLADGKSFAIFESVQVDVPVIFTTAYDEYALQAFDLNSIDYLLKPVNREKLRAGLEKFRKVSRYYGKESPNTLLYSLISELKTGTSGKYRERFLISRGDSMLPLKSSDIACFFAEDKVVMLLTCDNKRHIIPNTLEELETMLNPVHFFRVNRQFIVSADSVRKVHNYFNFKLKLELSPDPGIEIIVSRSRAAGFKAWMNGV